MDIDALITEKIQRMQDLNREMQKLGQQIGALQEQGRALHDLARELKGAIDGLAELKAKNEAEVKEKADKAKGLILPDKTLVALDGKTPIAKVEEPTTADRLTGTPDVKPTEEMPLSGSTVPAAVTLEVK